MFNIHRFKTLMLREWLQNRWTWLIVIAVLPTLVLITLPFGQVNMGNTVVVDDAVALVPLLSTPLLCVLMAWATVLFMATGLARRDVQDRSIEFWLSLPSTHAEHIGAQYSMHAFVFPLLALGLGLLLGLPLCALALLRFSGGLGGVDWAGLLQAAWVPVLLAVPALLLAALWMAPVVLGLMAASAWVKRLALPLIGGSLLFLGNFGPTQVALRQFAGDYFSRLGFLLEGLVGVLQQRTGDLMQGNQAARSISAGGYLMEALRDLASWPFAVGLGVALLSAWLLALKRRRGG